MSTARQTMSRATPTLRRLAAALIVIGNLGCGTIYLHNDEHQKLTRGASDEFAKAETEALFEQAGSRLESTLAAERTAARRRLNAARDTMLTGVIDGGSISVGELIRLHAETRLAELVDSAGADGLLAMGRLGIERDLSQTTVGLLSATRTALNGLRTQYQQQSGKSTNVCSDPSRPMSPLVPGGDAGRARQIYPLLQRACTRWIRATAEQTELHRVIGASGQYGLVLQRLEELRGQRAALEDTRAGLKATLDALEARYEAAVREAATPADLAAFVAKRDTIRDELGQVLSGLGDATAVVALLANHPGGGGVSEAVAAGFGRLVQAEFLGTNLQSLLTVSLEADADPPDEAGRVARSYHALVVNSVDHLARLDRALDPEAIPPANALLVRLAYQRHREAGARLVLAEHRARLQATELEARGMTNEIYYLWRAHRHASRLRDLPGSCGRPSTGEAIGMAAYLEACPDSDGSAALVALDHAWTRGRQLSMESAFARTSVAQRAALARTRANADVWFDLLEPALAELVAYGEGGIRTETIIELFKATGLAAIAVGVY